MNAKMQTDNTTKRTVEIVIEHDSDLAATLSAFQKVCNLLLSIGQKRMNSCYGL